ncbi:hypothetical protein ABZ260_25115 [Streptosporangium sp. NPDC006013]|uniref:hypothetical protein n=1 Tax=Streptosporangium sp. NPDC006013 TaxID=3155596 RepID=UPI0033B14023
MTLAALAAPASRTVWWHFPEGPVFTAEGFTCPLSAEPYVFQDVPHVFRHCVEEPAFCDEDGMPVVTASLWREAGDDCWRVGEIEYPEGESDPDGSAHLFELLMDPSPEAFQRFAEDYYGVIVDLDAVRHVYALRPLTQAVVTALNADLALEDLAEDLAAARYAGRGRPAS